MERFWSKVHKTDGCWEWTASCTAKGYGQFRVDGKNKYAHRISYEEHVGQIPEGLVIDHVCANKKCVNPDHLEAVTNRVNLWRSPNFGGNLTHCPHGHEYTSENTYVRRNGARSCRSCRRESRRRFEQAKTGRAA